MTRAHSTTWSSVLSVYIVNRPYPMALKWNSNVHSNKTEGKGERRQSQCKLKHIWSYVCPYHRILCESNEIWLSERTFKKWVKMITTFRVFWKQWVSFCQNRPDCYVSHLLFLVTDHVQDIFWQLNAFRWAVSFLLSLFWEDVRLFDRSRNIRIESFGTDFGPFR